ncbi:MAG: class I SAM-dependent methyltransferase [Candidatus Krumholzibacteriota bacterium]
MAFYSDFAGHYEKIFPFRRPVADFLDQWLPNEGRILDIGCGTGRYCEALDRTGRRSLGIDLDPGMIGEAGRIHPEGEFRILGMEQIGLLPAGSFAGIFCIGNVLPHLPAHRLAGFLVDVNTILEPGGVWVFQTVNFDPILGEEDFIFPEINLPTDQLTFLRWYEDIRTDRLVFHTSLAGPEGEIFAGEVALFPRTSVDYDMGHKAAGFEKLGHFADFAGKGFHPGENSGSVFVWRKP